MTRQEFEASIGYRLLEDTGTEEINTTGGITDFDPERG
jgi:hypothetical protein